MYHIPCIILVTHYSGSYRKPMAFLRPGEHMVRQQSKCRRHTEPRSDWVAHLPNKSTQYILHSHVFVLLLVYIESPDQRNQRREHHTSIKLPTRTPPRSIADYCTDLALDSIFPTLLSLSCDAMSPAACFFFARGTPPSCLVL